MTRQNVVPCHRSRVLPSLEKDCDEEEGLIVTDSPKKRNLGTGDKEKEEEVEEGGKGEG